MKTITADIVLNMYTYIYIYMEKKRITAKKQCSMSLSFLQVFLANSILFFRWFCRLLLYSMSYIQLYVLCCIVSYHTIPYQIISCHIISYQVVSYCAILYCNVVCHILLYYTMFCCSALHCLTLQYITLCYTMFNCIKLYCVML